MQNIFFLFLAIPALSGTLDQQAADLRVKCIANLSKVQSVVFNATTEVIRPTTTQSKVHTAAKVALPDTITWGKTAKKLKWMRPGGTPPAFVADGEAGTLKYVSSSASVVEEKIDESSALEMSSPSPRWLWNPAWLIPEKPTSVREDGNSLVVSTSAKHPIREIWLDKATGVIQRFTDSDAKGNPVRSVVISGWADHSGILLPATIEEEIKGKKNSLHRVTAISIGAINQPLKDSDFALP